MDDGLALSPCGHDFAGWRDRRVSHRIGLRNRMRPLGPQRGRACICSQAQADPQELHRDRGGPEPTASTRRRTGASVFRLCVSLLARPRHPRCTGSQRGSRVACRCRRDNSDSSHRPSGSWCAVRMVSRTLDFHQRKPCCPPACPRCVAGPGCVRHRDRLLRHGTGRGVGGSYANRRHPRRPDNSNLSRQWIRSCIVYVRGCENFRIEFSMHF